MTGLVNSDVHQVGRLENEPFISKKRKKVNDISLLFIKHVNNQIKHALTCMSLEKTN